MGLKWRGRDQTCTPKPQLRALELGPGYNEVLSLAVKVTNNPAVQGLGGIRTSLSSYIGIMCAYMYIYIYIHISCFCVHGLRSAVFKSGRKAQDLDFRGRMIMKTLLNVSSNACLGFRA